MNYIALLGDLNVPRNIILTAIRTVCIWIDTILYVLVGNFFNIILQISSIDQLSIISDLYNKIQSRVYVVIGILMIFKVTMSLLTYLANPDKVNDKQSGTGKLITRLVTSLLLLIFVPTLLFPLLSEIQVPLVNTVGRIITGNSTVVDNGSANSSGAAKAEETGITAALNMMSTFFHPNSDCGTVTDDVLTVDNIFEVPSKAAEACSDNEKDTYLYTYVPGVAFFVAAVALVLLIIIGLNVAIRAFKLMVLKVLAPIPILSYIDPKSAKDGILASYTKLFIQTYIDLFIQFAIFYLVLLIIGELGDMGNYASILGDTFNNAVSGKTVIDPSGISYILIIIGLLIFAFMAPKFIKKALNIKDSEFGTGLSGILASASILGNTAGATVNAVGASAAAGGGLLKNVGAGIAGAIGGLSTGAKAGFGSGKTDYSKIGSAIGDYNARTRTNYATGSTLPGRLETTLRSTFLGTNRANTLETEIGNMEAADKAMSAALDRANGEMKKSTETYGSIFKGSDVYTNYKDFAASYAAAKATGSDHVTYTGLNSNGEVITNPDGSKREFSMSLKDAEMNLGWIERENTANYIDKNSRHELSSDDRILDSYMQDVNAKLDGLGLSQSSAASRGDMKALQDEISIRKTEMKRELEKAKADANATKKK